MLKPDEPSIVESEPQPSTSVDSTLEPSSELGTSKVEEIQPTKFPFQFKDDPSSNHRNTSKFIDAQLGKEPSSVHVSQVKNHLTGHSLRPTIPPYPADPPNKTILTEATKVEWSEEVRRSSEVIRIISPSTTITCYIGGTVGEALHNPTVGASIMFEFSADTLLSGMPLAPTDKLFTSPSGLIFEYRGIARAVPTQIDKIEVYLDFHIFPTLDFDLLIGFPLEKLFQEGEYQGSLKGKASSQA